MKALLILEARMIFVSLGTDGAPTYRIETLDAGPAIVTGLDYSNLRLRTWVNGDLRQDSSTRDLVYSPNKLLSYVSQYITLLPGDVIFTGTPGKTQAVTTATRSRSRSKVLADCAIPWPFDSTAMSGEFP